MEPGDISKYVAPPARVVMTVLMTLLVWFLLQTVLIETKVMVEAAKLRAITAEQAKTQTREKVAKINRMEKRFLPDGKIHLLDTMSQYRRGRVTLQIYDTNETLVWEGRRKNRPYEYLLWARAYVAWYESFTRKQMKTMQLILPESLRSLEIPVNSEKETVRFWRYVPSRDLFAGYDVEGSKIGYFGSTGFTETKSEAKPFGKFRSLLAWCPEDSFSPTLLWQTEHRIYQIIFEKQAVEVIFESPTEKINWVRLNAWGFLPYEIPEGPTIEYRPLIHCLTGKSRHHLIMDNPSETRVITVPQDWEADSVNFTATEEGIFLYHHGTEERPPAVYAKSARALHEWRASYKRRIHRDWVEFCRVDEQGEPESLNRFEWIVPAEPENKIAEVVASTRTYVTVFSPPLYKLAWYLAGDRIWWFRHESDEPIREPAAIIEDTQPSNSTLNLVLSAGMMGFAFWHGWSRRTSWGRLILWLVLVGAFNLAGLLSYLALNHTSVIKCSTCGRRRGLERVDCVRCGAELAVPERRKFDLVFGA